MRRQQNALMPAPSRSLLAVVAGLLIGMSCALAEPPRRTEGIRAPAWQQLSAEQRHLLDAFQTQWNQWPAAERGAWIALTARFPSMPPPEQLKARQQIRQWAALSPEQRRVARANYGLARRLPESQRVEQWRRYQEMTAEQRSVLRKHGSTSNTAARFAGSRTGLAKDAAQPLVAEPVHSK